MMNKNMVAPLMKDSQPISKEKVDMQKAFEAVKFGNEINKLARDPKLGKKPGLI